MNNLNKLQITHILSKMTTRLLCVYFDVQYDIEFFIQKKPSKKL